MQMLSDGRWDHKEPDYVNFKHKLNDVQKMNKHTIIRRTIALIGILIAILVIPCLIGYLSTTEMWVVLNVLEWSNGYFWRGFLVGSVFEIIMFVVCCIIAYYIDNKI